METTKFSLIKKVLCAIVGGILAIVELAILGVSPLKALASVILPAGYVSLCMGIFSDWTKDKEIKLIDWIKYALAFVCIALLGIAVIKNNMYFAIISAVFASGSIIIHLIGLGITKQFTADTSQTKIHD